MIERTKVRGRQGEREECQEEERCKLDRGVESTTYLPACLPACLACPSLTPI